MEARSAGVLRPTARTLLGVSERNEKTGLRMGRLARRIRLRRRNRQLGRSRAPWRCRVAWRIHRTQRTADRLASNPALASSRSYQSSAANGRALLRATRRSACESALGELLRGVGGARVVPVNVDRERGRAESA